jgi:hypothetical protein
LDGYNHLPNHFTRVRHHLRKASKGLFLLLNIHNFQLFYKNIQKRLALF